jgi:hypothetical protein
MRRVYVLLIAIFVIVGLGVSAILARVWSADGAETLALTSLVTAEAHGDVPAALALIRGCATSPSCRARLAQDVAGMRRAGTVSIVQIQPSTGFSLTGTLGIARVAWVIGSSLPIVQCVRVRRAGDALQGLRVELLEVSPRIKSDADCPSRF